MKLSEYRSEMKERFFALLNTRTGWGKEMVKSAYIDADNEVITKALEEQEK